MKEDLALLLKRDKFQNVREIIIPGLLTFCVLMFLFWMREMDANIQYLDFFAILKMF